MIRTMIIAAIAFGAGYLCRYVVVQDTPPFTDSTSVSAECQPEPDTIHTSSVSGIRYKSSCKDLPPGEYFCDNEFCYPSYTQMPRDVPQTAWPEWRKAAGGAR